MKKKIEKDLLVLCPLVPNFIKTIDENGIEKMLPITDFSEEEIREVGSEWTNNLLRKCKYKK